MSGIRWSLNCATAHAWNQSINEEWRVNYSILFSKHRGVKNTVARKYVTILPLVSIPFHLPIHIFCRHDESSYPNRHDQLCWRSWQSDLHVNRSMAISTAIWSLQMFFIESTMAFTSLISLNSSNTCPSETKLEFVPVFSWSTSESAAILKVNSRRGLEEFREYW